MHQVRDVMTAKVDVISPDATIQEAAQHMAHGDFGMIPVGEDGQLIGAISDRDIAIRAVAEGRGPETRVRDIMSRGLAWVYEDMSVEEAARIMSEQQVRRLPVVNHDKRLVGIVALGDFAVDHRELAPAAEALSEISKPE